MSLRPGRGQPSQQQGYPPPPPPRTTARSSSPYGSPLPPPPPPRAASPALSVASNSSNGYHHHHQLHYSSSTTATNNNSSYSTGQPTSSSYYGSSHHHYGAASASSNGGYGTAPQQYPSYNTTTTSSTTSSTSNHHQPPTGFSNSQTSSYGGYGSAATATTTTSNTPLHKPVPSRVADGLNKRRGSRKTASSGGSSGGLLGCLSSWSFWSTLLALTCGALCVWYRLQLNGMLEGLDAESVEVALTELTTLTARERQATSNMQAVKDSLRLANEQRLALEKEQRQLKRKVQVLQDKYESPAAQEEFARIRAREEGWSKHVEILQHRTRRESQRSVREKFGDGPHQVEFAVLLPGRESELFFVVELASLAVMPHAAHIFLEQVWHGLWNKAWFYINGPHVMQAGPETDDIEEGDSEHDIRFKALRPFQELSLESLAFPEYSDEFPHNPWTLGFTGRPGGPDFYINKVDNTDSHGPGGQYHHELEEFADPCFAKVIKGFDTLETIARIQTILTGEYQFFFEYPVKITRAVILENPIPIDEESLATRQEGFGQIELVGDLEETDEPRKPQRERKQHVFDHQVEP